MPDSFDPEVPDGRSPPPEGTAGVSNILALDVGNKRIGLALSISPLAIARPLFTLHRTTERADLKSIGRILRKYAVTEVLVGLPLHASGELSAQAVKSKAFAESLRQQHPEIPVHLLDERLTTMEAHSLLDRSPSGRRREGKNSRKERTEVVDQIAAILLLEAFLSVSSPRLLPPPDDPQG